MPKAEIFQDIPLPTLSDTQELWRWLYTELRAAILDGRLKRGARLPSTRSLAQQYGLSRGTVTTAFEQLQAEGYTRTEIGSGTYVASGLPDPRVGRAVRPTVGSGCRPPNGFLETRPGSVERYQDTSGDSLRWGRLFAVTSLPSISSR